MAQGRSNSATSVAIKFVPALPIMSKLSARAVVAVKETEIETASAARQFIDVYPVVILSEPYHGCGMRQSFDESVEWPLGDRPWFDRIGQVVERKE